MAVRAGAGAGLQQRLHQHPHDRRQAPLRRALGARPHRPHQGMHPGRQASLQFLQSKRHSARLLFDINPMPCHVQLIKELGAPVEHIVLPTFAYEHKIFLGPFSRKFPRAQVWVAPRQWSWPVNLPLEFFGVFRSKPLEDEDDGTPWAAEIEQKVLSSPEVGIPSSSLRILISEHHRGCIDGSWMHDNLGSIQALGRMWRWRSTISLPGHCW